MPLDLSTIGKSAYKGLTLSTQDTTTQDNTYDPAAQVEGYKTRFAGSGIDVENATDTRNAVEKALNLNENQSTFLDIFEVWERPQRAVYGAIEALQKGGNIEDVKQAAKAGISGEDEVFFKDLLHGWGLKDSGEKLGWDDVIGFAGEVFADPMDLALLPVSATVKAAKLMNSAGDMAKYMKKAGVFESIMKNGGELADFATKGDDLVGIVEEGLRAKQLLRNSTGLVDDASREAARRFDILREAVGKADLGKEVVRKAPSEIVFGGAARGIGKGFKGADWMAKKGLNFMDSTGKAVDNYTNMQKAVRGFFDNAARAPRRAFEAAWRNIGKEGRSQKAMQAMWEQEAVPLMQKIADETGMTLDEVSQHVIDYTEFKYNPKAALESIIDESAQLPLTGETVDQVRALLKSPLLRQSTASGFVADIPDYLGQVQKATIKDRDFFLDSARKKLDELTGGAVKAPTPAPTDVADPLGRIIADPLTPVDLTGGVVKGTDTATGAVKGVGTPEGLKAIVTDPLTIKNGTPAQTDALKALIDSVSKTEDPEEMLKLVEEYLANPDSVLGDGARQIFNGSVINKRMAQDSYDNALFNKLYRKVDIDGVEAYQLLDADKIGQGASPLAESLKAHIKEIDERFADLGALELRKTLEELKADELFTKSSPTIDRIRKIIEDPDIQKALPSGHPLKGANLDDLLTEVTEDVTKVTRKNAPAAAKKAVTTEDIGKIVDEFEVKWMMDAGGNSQIQRAVTTQAAQIRKMPPEQAMAELTKIAKSKKSTELVQRLSDVSGVGKAVENVVEETIQKGTKSLGYRIKPEAVDALKGFIDESNHAARLGAETIRPKYRTVEELAQLNQRYNKLTPGTVPYVDDLETVSNMYSDLARVNDEIFGTKIKSLLPEGYIKHKVADEFPTLGGKGMPGTVGEKDIKYIEGNLRAFNTREYPMSIHEANRLSKWNADNVVERFKNGDISLTPEEVKLWQDRATLDMFSKEINDSVAAMITYTAEQSAAARKVEALLIHSTFANPEVLKPLEKGAYKSSIPAGYVRIDESVLRTKLNGFKNILENPDDYERFIASFLDKNKGGVFELDSNVWNMIKVVERTGGDSQTLQTLAKSLDTVNNLFKKTKLLSPGFQMRNIVGNFTNMYLAGMSPAQILRRTAEARTVLKRGDDVFNKAITNGVDSLSKTDKKIYDYYVDFIDNNFANAGAKVMDIDEIVASLSKNAQEGKHIPVAHQLNKIMEINNNMNTLVDSTYRMAMLMHATENPDMFLKLGLESPAAMVRHVLFDPEDLTHAEKAVFKRAVPFYTFAKKNLQYHMKNVFDNPVRYHRLRKTIDQSWQAFADINVDDIESYKNENMWIPIPGMSKDGSYVALKASLPMGDFGEFLESPAKKIISSMAPAFRAPFELALNKQVFTGRPIEDFEGQPGYMFPWMDRKTEYLLSQTGLDVPMATVSDIVTSIGKLTNGQVDTPLDFINQSLGRSMTSTGSVQQAQVSKDYEELQQMQDLLKYYKATGVEIKTISEIENQNKTLMDLGTKLNLLTQ